MLDFQQFDVVWSHASFLTHCALDIAWSTLLWTLWEVVRSRSTGGWEEGRAGKRGFMMAGCSKRGDGMWKEGMTSRLPAINSL
jgi:hypothetical protein